MITDFQEKGKDMKKRLFQYAVIVHTYEEGTNSGGNFKIYKDSQMVVEPTNILAKDEKEVVFKVTRLIPAEHASDPDNVEILVRNF